MRITIAIICLLSLCAPTATGQTLLTTPVYWSTEFGVQAPAPSVFRVNLLRTLLD
jgi:hypothetical protein